MKFLTIRSISLSYSWCLLIAAEPTAFLNNSLTKKLNSFCTLYNLLSTRPTFGSVGYTGSEYITRTIDDRRQPEQQATIQNFLGFDSRDSWIKAWVSVDRRIRIKAWNSRACPSCCFPPSVRDITFHPLAYANKRKG